MVFGTSSGHIVLADRDFHVSDRKYKVFKGEIKGIVLLVDPSNSNKQYVFAIGDDSNRIDVPEDQVGYVPSTYFFKVFNLSDMSNLYILLMLLFLMRV